MTPELLIAPPQHWEEPPGRVLQPEPPHAPHEAAQQAEPDLMPTCPDEAAPRVSHRRESKV